MLDSRLKLVLSDLALGKQVLSAHHPASVPSAGAQDFFFFIGLTSSSPIHGYFERLGMNQNHLPLAELLGTSVWGYSLPAPHHKHRAPRGVRGSKKTVFLQLHEETGTMRLSF